MYEPTRHELYAPVQHMGDRITIYHADTVARVAELTLPGRGISFIQAAPGKVFFKVEDAFGMHVIDAATRTVRPWAVDGQLVDPQRINIEPSGRVMIAQYERHLVAIDVPSARTIAQLPAIGLAGVAFDPGQRHVVVAMHEPPDHPRVRLSVYALGGGGFTFVSDLKNPAEDSGWLVSTADGFLQRSRDSLLVWQARPVQSLR